MELIYPTGYLVRKVKSNGQVCVVGPRIQLSEALIGCHVGLEPLSPQRYGVWFCRLRLGELDMSEEKFYAATARLSAASHPT